MPQPPKVAASAAIAGNGCRPVSAVRGPERSRSRWAYSAFGMCPAAQASAPHSGRARSKRQSTMTQSGSARCAARAAGSISVVGTASGLSSLGAGMHFRRCALSLQSGYTSRGGAMAIEIFWGSGSPFAWRVLLALEYKRLPYVSHLLQFSKQEHKSPQMLALNPRGRVPVLKDGDYVCFESLAILYYLDLKYPQPPIFGRTPEEAGTIMRVICEYQAYIEPRLNSIISGVFIGKEDLSGDEITAAMHAVANEARTIEGRLSKSDWIVGDAFSAVDMVIFPGIQLLKRALQRPPARELSSRFMPVEVNYPSLGRWLARVAALPGYQRTYPPPWGSTRDAE